jgi:hypothetical protein
LLSSSYSLSLLFTASLPPSSHSSSSLILLPHSSPSTSHYLSPSFLSVIITTSLPPSSFSLLISLLALLFLLPLSLTLFPYTWLFRSEGGEVVRRRIERKEGERQ